jgi:hypothetical protein
MSTKTGNNNGVARGIGIGVAMKTAVACAAYLLGIATSPFVIPADYFASPGVVSVNPAVSNDTTVPPRQPDNPRVDSSTSSVPDVPTETIFPPGGLSPLDMSYVSLLDFGTHGGVDPFAGVEIFVHRNGEPDPCSRQQAGGGGGKREDEDDDDDDALSRTSRALLRSAILTLPNGEDMPLESYNNKYAFDAMLTRALAVGGGRGVDDATTTTTTASSSALLYDRGEACGPTWDNHILDTLPAIAALDISSMLKFCDMGVDRTTVQLDHGSLIDVPGVGTKPCHFHTREGVRVTGLGQLAGLARAAAAATTTALAGECANSGTCDVALTTTNRRGELHLYAVQAGRQFMFAPKYVGEVFDLPHVSVPRNLPVRLEVISIVPKVFDVYNFFGREESAAIVDKALKETSDTHKMKRSSTGASGYSVNSQRTSENGFDTHGSVAQAVKRRCMNVLGE